MRQVAKFEMRGAEYVPKKKPKKQKKAVGAKAEKVLGWGGFDDQVKATEVQAACTISDPVDELNQKARWCLGLLHHGTTTEAICCLLAVCG